MSLEIVKSYGDDTLARVFVAKTNDGAHIEFVESVQPPVPRDEKWVLIISTLKGCPIQCPICDAGGDYKGKLSTAEILSQIDYLVQRRFSNGIVSPKITKIQFARMGDPALNQNVLEALKQLPSLYKINLMPSISTVAPKNCHSFIESLKQIKDSQYRNGMFQMQFSIHTTNDAQRRQLIPAATLPLGEISKLGSAFFEPGDRKVTLNFAAVKGFELDASVIANQFDSDKFIVKLTPVNPTLSSAASGLEGQIDDDSKRATAVCKSFKKVGFDVILSIGETRENQIGSNCGMYAAKMNDE